MKILISVLIFFASAFQCYAEKIPLKDLFNTGLDQQGSVLPDGSVDPHYNIITSADESYPGPQAMVSLSSGFPMDRWVPNNVNSKWIAPRTDAGSFNEVGLYVYRIKFDLSKFKHNTAEIYGRWSSDNEGVDILINGKNTGYQTPVEAYYGMFGFAITEGFIEGINTIDFVVNNVNAPTGLRVEIKGMAEPKEFAYR